MANSGDRNLHGGDQSEYLAQFMLSYLGAAAFVPRQEDIGIDFHCALYEDIESRHRTYHSPFTLQLGSVTDGKVTKKFVYGGVTDAKKEENQRHRDWEIRFLREQQIPFFVGTIDKDNLRLRIYSTSAVWFILHRVERIGEIELCLDTEHNPIDGAVDGEIDVPGGKLPRFRIPLNKPIVDVTVADIDTPTYKGASDALKAAIEWDQRNLIYRTLGCRVSWRPLEYERNSPLTKVHYSFVPHPEIFTKGRDWLRAIVVTLAMANYDQMKLQPASPKFADDHAKVRGFLETLPLSDEDKNILRDCAGIDFLTPDGPAGTNPPAAPAPIATPPPPSTPAPPEV